MVLLQLPRHLQINRPRKNSNRKALFLGPFLLCIFDYALASDLGITGIIDIPSARMMNDGELKATVSKQDSLSVYSLNYQATPWFETTFRYVGYEDFFYYDRSYEAKLRILKESEYLPQISIGIRDLIGTGVFGSEYLVGSKKYGNFDFTVGVGWGRLAGNGDLKNPLSNLSNNFEIRDADAGLGGDFSFSNYYSGKNIGIFAGATYEFQQKPLKFLIEYNPDEYDFATTRGKYNVESPISIGLEWKLFENITLTSSYQNGSEFGFKISASLNSKVSKEFKVNPIKSSLMMTEEEFTDGLELNVWYDRLLYDFEKSGLNLFSADYLDASNEVTLEIGNKKFHHWPDAISQALRLADLHLPKKYKSINLVLNERGNIVQVVQTIRPSLLVKKSPEVFKNQIDIVSPRKISAPRNTTSFAKFNLPINITLQNRIQVMDPDEPFRYQLYARLASNIKLSKNLTLKSSYAVDIENNFDTIKRESNSVLPRVRSEVKKYLQEGESGINQLYFSYKNSFDKYIHYRLEAGIFEDMFSGIGGEIIYKPTYSRLALGLSAHQAKKRDYGRDFNHLDYETFTGFISTYWASPLYNFDIGLHAGKYLAKDKGFTLELKRTFDNGWKVGVWATKTNVSAEEFGEGSFDKGLYFKVPLYTIFNRDSRNSYQTYLRSIQRDGGARLEGFSGNLWHSLRDVRYDLLEKNKHRMRP